MTFEIVAYSRITGYGLHRQVLATVKRPSAAEHKFAEHVDLKAGHYASHAAGEAITVTPMEAAFMGGIKSTTVAMVGTHETIVSIERKARKEAS
jgi:hypothetical protein